MCMQPFSSIFNCGMATSKQWSNTSRSEATEWFSNTVVLEEAVPMGIKHLAPPEEAPMKAKNHPCTAKLKKKSDEDDVITSKMM